MLAQKLILSYSSRLIVQLIQIIASIIVARIAGPTVLGTVAFGLAYVTMFTSISDLGLTTAFIKKLSEGVDEEKCLGTFVRLKMILVFLYTFSVIVFFIIQKVFLKVQFESNDHIIVIFIQLAASTVGLFYSIPKATFAAYTQQAKADIPNLIQTLSLQVLRVIIVLLGFGAVALAFGNFLSTLIILPMFIYLFKNHKIGSFDKDLAKEYFIISLPVTLTGILSTLFTTLDQVLLQFFTNSEQLGYYTAGFRIGGFVLLISQSIGGLFFPLFSKASNEKNYETIKRLVNKFERFSYIYIMPILILVTIFAKEIVLLLLGSKFINSTAIMVVINIAMFLNVVNSPHGSILAGLGQFKKTLIIVIWQFITFLILVVIFTYPSFLNLSGFGTALSILIANLLNVILHRIYSKKYLNSISNMPTIYYLSFGILNFTVFSLLKKNIPMESLFVIVIFIIVYFVITFYLLKVFNLLKKEDLQYLKTILNLKELHKYIKSEM